MNDRSLGFTLTGSTDLSLLGRVRRKDQAAWSQFVRLYGPLVYYWCGLAELQESDRDDVMQDVFRSVFVAIGDFRREPSSGSFRGWLRTITRSKIADHFRRCAKRAAVTDGSAALDELVAPAVPDLEAGESEETGRLLRQALALMESQFQTATWTAFWRTAIDGAPAVEVADDLGMTADAVRQAKARVLRRLKEEFAGLLFENQDPESRSNVISIERGDIAPTSGEGSPDAES